MMDPPEERAQAQHRVLDYYLSTAEAAAQQRWTEALRIMEELRHPGADQLRAALAIQSQSSRSSTVVNMLRP